LLQTSLTEEQAMAAWLESNTAALTLKYVERRASGETASH
jgi:ferritin-like metal-binding protein YciE